MNAQTAKITPGEWVVHKHISGGIFVETEMPVASVFFYYAAAAEANAALIAEAGTVANETGLTPRQLADQRAELLEALKEVVGEWREGYGLNCIDRIRAAIAKATGERL